MELLQAVQAATSLLKAYRTHGHLAARVEPLGSEPKDTAIQPENVGLTPELMSQIPAEILRIGVERETLLEALLCGCARPTAGRSPTRSSTSPRTSSGCGCGT